MRRMRLLALSSLAVLVVAAGCGGGSSSSSSSGGPAGTIDKTPVTIVLWDMWSGREAQPFKDALKRFQVKYPWITIKEEVQPNPPNDTFDPNLVNAINGGNPPDVAMPFGPDYVGQYCAGGLWQDLAPYMKADGMSINDFAPAAITYTNFGGKQCALPSLTDAFGLYYNKEMFAKAGIAGPPKTMDELMADAKKLTVRNPDGTIKVAGFVPLNQWEELGPGDLANAWGAKWFDSSGKPQLADRSGLGVRIHVAEAADRLVRLRQHHQVLRRQHEQRVQSQQRVRERQGGDDVRRRVANRVHQGRQASDRSTTALHRFRPLPTIPRCTGRPASAGRSWASPRVRSIPTRRGCW